MPASAVAKQSSCGDTETYMGGTEMMNKSRLSLLATTIPLVLLLVVTQNALAWDFGPGGLGAKAFTATIGALTIMDFTMASKLPDMTIIKA